MASRRDFIKKTGLLASVLPFGKLATLTHKTTKPLLVHIRLWGGFDGLMAVHPSASSHLKRLRPSLMSQKMLPLDEHWELHPAFKPLYPWFETATLAIIQGVGNPTPLTQHLAAQHCVETGNVATTPQATSWLSTCYAPYVTTFNQVTLTTHQHISYPQHLELQGFWASSFGLQLQQIGNLLKHQSAQTIEINTFGWDTHVAQHASFHTIATNFAQNLSQFLTLLSQINPNALVLVSTEFGRTISENMYQGTDHGHGSCMFVFGRSVKGGKVYAHTQTLLNAIETHQSALPVTIDFRTIYQEILHTYFGNTLHTLGRIAKKASPINMLKRVAFPATIS